MKKYIITLILGIFIGISINMIIAHAKEVDFLEKQSSQSKDYNLLGEKITITKYYDNQNGYCVYTIVSPEGAGISVVK